MSSSESGEPAASALIARIGRFTAGLAVRPPVFAFFTARFGA